jgi:signal transduction histidine kinase
LGEKFDETLTAKARALITASEIDDGGFEIDLTVKNFAGFGKEGNDFFEIRRADGTVFKRSPSFPKGHQQRAAFGTVSRPPDAQAVTGETELPDGRNARFYAQIIAPKGDKQNRFQDLYLIVASSTERLDEEMRYLGVVLAVASAVALLVLVPIIWLSLRRVLRPVARLTEELEQIKPHDLNRRIGADGLPVELKPVAASLNAWLGRLEVSVERERQFAANAAHELRSPLAELKMVAELGAMGEDEASPEKFVEMREMIDDMTTMLDGLHHLSRGEGAGTGVTRTEVNLRESIAQAVERVSAISAARSVAFQVEIVPGEFLTDPGIWKVILDNLIGNAARYSPEASLVHVFASPQQLLIRNPAPLLTSDDLNHLFDRFWRKEHSRQRNTHSGLGLSIVRSSVAALGGRCEVSLTEHGELILAIEWQNDTPRG